MVAVDATIVNVALPEIQHDLHLSQGGLTWIINAYTLTFAGFLLFGGRAADLWGRRLVFQLGIALFSLMSLLGGLSVNGGELISARAVQGLGAAALSPATLAILMTTFTEDKARTRALGIWASVGGAGVATGVLAGGILTDLLSWRWILFINVPIGVLLLILTPLCIKESRGVATRGSLDWSGAVTVTAGLVVLAYGIVSTADHGWASARVIGFLTAGVLLLVAFVVIEGRVREPLVPLRLFRKRNLSVANLMIFLIVPAPTTLLFFLSQYLQGVHGYSPLRTGFAFLPLPLAHVIGAQISSRLIGRLDVRPLLIAGPVFSLAGLLWLAQLKAGDTYPLHVGLPAALVTFGVAVAFVPITLAANVGINPADAGLASGLVNTNQQVGGAIGLAAMVTIAASRTSAFTGHSHAAALTSGYVRTFEVCAGLVVLAGVIAVTVLPRHVDQRGTEELEELQHSPSTW
jgi:EmrB/QacA subfamily drug resistance transporter